MSETRWKGQKKQTKRDSKIIADYLAGQSFEQIGVKYKLSPVTIQFIISQNQIYQTKDTEMKSLKSQLNASKFLATSLATKHLELKRSTDDQISNLESQLKEARAEVERLNNIVDTTEINAFSNLIVTDLKAKLFLFGQENTQLREEKAQIFEQLISASSDDVSELSHDSEFVEWRDVREIFEKFGVTGESK